MNCGHRLAHLRKTRRLTQQEVAQAIGVSRAAYSHYEHNRRKPNYLILKRISNLFQVSTDYLLGRTEDPIAMLPHMTDYQAMKHRSNNTVTARAEPAPKEFSIQHLQPHQLHESRIPFQIVAPEFELTDLNLYKKHRFTIDGQAVTEEEAQKFIQFIRSERKES